VPEGGSESAGRIEATALAGGDVTFGAHPTSAAARRLAAAPDAPRPRLIGAPPIVDAYQMIMSEW